MADYSVKSYFSGGRTRLVKQFSKYRGILRHIKHDETFLKHIRKWVSSAFH